MKTQRTFALKLFALSFTSCIATALAPVSATWAHSQPPYSTVRVSVSSKGVQGNGNSYDAQISANGRFVVFRSSASNLVAGDHNGVDDVFVHDLKTRRTKRVSVSSAGVESNGGSGDAYSFRDRNAFISDNGRYVAFKSDASNLVAGDDNGAEDIFVRDLKTGVTRRPYCGYEGCDGYNDVSFSYDLNSLSGNGRFIALTFSPADAIGIIQLVDLKTGEIKTVGGTTPYLGPPSPSLSFDGRFIVFADEYYGVDCLVNGRSIGTPALSIIVKDIKSGVRHCLETQDVDKFYRTTTLSADGRFVAYNNYDVGLIVRNTNFKSSTKPVSFTISGFDPDLSADGRFVAFTSVASNLVKRDSNGVVDVFVHDLKAGVTRRMSVNSAGKEGNKATSGASISANGRLVAFTSDASNLVKGDTNNMSDVFVRLSRR